MSNFPSLTSKKLLSFYIKQGFIIDHQSGSHIILYKESDKKRAVIPFHTRDLPRGTIFAILKETGFSKKDFFNLYK
jgi:predicted RNA binding protein YcfA (HicA-like mRNA interferase family)